MTTLYSNNPFDLVCPFDPALDMTVEEADRYAELRDQTLLKIRPGQSPTVYTIRRLPQSVATYIRSVSKNSIQENNFAFMAGVVRVTNLHALDGSEHASWTPTWVLKMDPESQSMTSEERELFPFDEAQDIGSVALARADLRKGRPVCFVPPPSSGLAWGKMNRSSLRVAESDLPSKKLDEAREPQGENS